MKIKFRLAKRKRNLWNLFGLLKKEFYFMDGKVESNYLEYPLVQQFIGSYDCDGNEIYEGDRLDSNNRIIK